MKRAFIAAGALLLSVGCHPSRPVIDPGPKPVVQGTISGIVGNGTSPLGGRKITAVNVETGARFDTASTSNGGYTVRVPPGTYRLEFELRAGERLSAAPQPTQVDSGDLDAGRDFVVTVAAR
ncbi:MAG: carboxypeptidase-like regulatory domain-containing protein [Vicinamibacterales bacterium]